MVKYFGCDVETPMGWCKVIATNIEAREVKTFNDIIGFLTQRKYHGAKFFHFNLRFDIESILKLTKDMDFLKRLYMEGAAPEGIEYNKNVTIRYIPGKLFKLCKNKSCVTCLDISQFFGGWKLDDVARKYLGSYKNPISGERIGKEKGYYERHKEEVIEYCRVDAELTLKAAMLMKRTIESVKMPKGKLSFRNPISQAKVSELYIRDNYKYPKVPQQLELFHWLSEQAYHGGVFSTERRGMFDRPLYSYDINSCYPYQMTKLKHWANGRFVNVKKPNEVDTPFGWYLCEFDCSFISYPDYSHPYEVEFCYEDVNPEQCHTVLMNPRRVVYPVGMRRQWVTKMEYEFMLRNNFPVSFRGGIAWEEQSTEHPSPFEWIEDVYDARKTIKNKDKEDIRQWALKIALNGVYGKAAQKRKGIGALTNFFYASTITAGARIQISEAGLKKPSHVIEYATDSLLLDSPLDLPVSDKLGEWTEEVYTKGLVIGSGIRQQWLADGSFVTHARGLTYKNEWDMLDAIKNGFNKKEKKPNIDCDYLYFERTRPVHLGEVIFHHKVLSLKNLGVFTDVSKRLSVNTDKKRNWQREYTSFRDMLESDVMCSEPLVYGEDVK